MTRKLLYTICLLFALGFQAQAQVPSYIPTDSLVAWWPFNGNANDESGNGNNGVVNGAIPFEDRFGNTNSAYSFDGIDNDILVLHNIDFNSYPLTINLWMKSNGNNNDAVLITKYCCDNWLGWNISVSAANDDTATFNREYLLGECLGIFQNSCGAEQRQQLLAYDELWHMYTFRVDESGASIFWDGVMVASQNWVGQAGPVSNNLDISIGSSYSNGSFYAGLLDDIGIWESSLSDVEIQELYDSNIAASLFTVGSGVTDIDGNSYSSVIINEQEWMSENLNVTKFCNGDQITNATWWQQWFGIVEPRRCAYNANELYSEQFGSIYNFWAVRDERNLCPCGWHVATLPEYASLEEYLGGHAVAAGKIKGVDTWTGDNVGDLNASGLNMLAGGNVEDNFYFEGLGGGTVIWLNTVADDDFGGFFAAFGGSSESAYIDDNYPMKGYYVRCIKDLPSFQVFNDLDADCSFNELTSVVPNALVSIEPGGIVAMCDDNGVLNLVGENSLPDGNYTATVNVENTSWEANCFSSIDFSMSNGVISGQSDFPLTNTNPCPSPNITITCPTMRRCSENAWPIYVQACNTYNGTGILENAYALVELDANIIVDPATTPPYTLVNGLYQFEIGNLNPGQCTTIIINANFSCDLELGETLCMEATLYPVPECTEIEGPGPSECTEPWDHSSLEVEGECDEDTGTITFTIENDGEAMVCPSEVRVYVDGELFETHYIQLGAESDTTFTYPTNGGTWILQADQHPLHPGNSHPNDHVEGCGDVEGEGDGDDDNDDGDDDDDDEWEPGLVDDLPCGDESPFVDVYCGEVVGSYDPNDKQGFPNGVGETHDIMPNEQLQYLIRFQNTGTAPAYTVVIRDTLDTDLDIFSVTPSVASHDYSFTMYGERVLQWTFNNIMLADSFSNEEASHGFITYTVNQVADLTDGSQITNSAAIYFDSNEPVITNTTLHTINHCLFQEDQVEIDTTAYDVYTAPDGAQYTESGDYTAVLTNAAGCDSTITIHLTVLVGVLEMDSPGIHVFPIPASQAITALWNADATNYVITTPDGRAVITGRLNRGTNTIDISTLATGNYFLKADNRVTRFVVK